MCIACAHACAFTVNACALTSSYFMKNDLKSVSQVCKRFLR